MKRTCKACDGLSLRVVHVSKMDHSKPIISRHYTRAEAEASLCQACNGTGQVTERIPASDAIADAKSLYEAWWGFGTRDTWEHLPFIAQDHGLSAARMMLGAYLVDEDDDLMRWHASAAARAAFRAVPGLRG